VTVVARYCAAITAKPTSKPQIPPKSALATMMRTNRIGRASSALLCIKFKGKLFLRKPGKGIDGTNAINKISQTTEGMASFYSQQSALLRNALVVILGETLNPREDRTCIKVCLRNHVRLQPARQPLIVPI